MHPLNALQDKESALQPASLPIEHPHEAHPLDETGQEPHAKQQTPPSPFQRDTLSTHQADKTVQAPNGWAMNPYPYGWLPYETTSQAQDTSAKAVPVETTKQRSSFWSTVSSLWSPSEASKTVEPTAASEKSSQPAVNTVRVSASYDDTSASLNWLYEALANWAGDMREGWNNYWKENPADVSSGAFEKIDSEFLAPLSPKERKSLAKLLQTFHQMMSKLREEFTDGEIDQLMELVLKISRENKNEEFSLQKAALMRKQETLRDEQILRLKQVDESMDLLKRNQWWSHCTEIATALGFISFASMAGSGATALAVLYTVGSAVNSRMGDPFENVIGRGIALTQIGRAFGIKDQEEAARYAAHTIKLLIGLTVCVGMYQFKPAATSWTVFIQAASSSLKGGAIMLQGWTNVNYSLKEGEVRFQAFKIEEAQKAVEVELKKFADAQKDRNKLWTRSGKQQRAFHEAKTSVFR